MNFRVNLLHEKFKANHINVQNLDGTLKHSLKSYLDCIRFNFNLGELEKLLSKDLQKWQTKKEQVR